MQSMFSLTGTQSTSSVSSCAAVVGFSYIA
jgi:hypothetical protein